MRTKNEYRTTSYQYTWSGGGDIKENLIQLCTQCHINTHSGQYPTKDDCLNKVAEREGITYDEAYAINRRSMGYDV